MKRDLAHVRLTAGSSSIICSIGYDSSVISRPRSICRSTAQKHTPISISSNFTKCPTVVCILGCALAFIPPYVRFMGKVAQSPLRRHSPPWIWFTAYPVIQANAQPTVPLPFQTVMSGCQVWILALASCLVVMPTSETLG